MEVLMNPPDRNTSWVETLFRRGSDWLGRLRAISPGFEGQRYLARWLFLSTSIGIVAGLGAVVFYTAIQLCTKLFLGGIVGYAPPSPMGEGSTVLIDMAHAWVLPLVTTVGGLISGMIVFGLAPEAEGHGTDAAIESIHKKGGAIRARIPLIKLVASAITIGSGGSGGREGPAAQISAGFGSLMGKWLRLDVQNRRIAVAAGIGAGIGAIFRAPLGGALLSAEILYVHDLEVEALIPGLIASIVGYSIFGAFFGYSPIFGSWPQIGFDQPIQLIYYAVLGVVCGLVGILYAKSFYGTHEIFHRLKLPNWVKPGIGGLLVGLMGLVLPACLHMGYGWVQIAMGSQASLLPLWVVLVLPFAKILSTSLSIGSGGSGGIFGPGMVIGGMVGASFWRLFYPAFHGMPTSAAPFVIIGMIGVFGGIAHAPLAVMLMVAEMTGNLSLLAPAMIVVAISTAITGDNTIYRSQIPDRASSPAHRVRMSFPLLSSLLVRDASKPCNAVQVTSGLPTTNILDKDPDSGLVLLDGSGKFAGVVDSGKFAKLSQGPVSDGDISKIVMKDPVVVNPDEPMDVALEQLTVRGLSWAPVVDEGYLSGKLTVKDAIATYRNTLERSIRRTNALPGSTTLFQAQLKSSSPLAGKTLRDAGFPPSTLVVSIMRQAETVFPHGDTRLQTGDIVVIMADPDRERALREFLGDVDKAAFDQTTRTGA
jgi:CIC family chloride channel protein